MTVILTSLLIIETTDTKFSADNPVPAPSSLVTDSKCVASLNEKIPSKKI